MVDLSKIRNIYLYSSLVSFRGGIDKLSNIILTNYTSDEVNNCLFIFFNNQKTQFKAIEFNDDGIWLYQKKLYGNKLKDEKISKLESQNKN